MNRSLLPMVCLGAFLAGCYIVPTPGGIAIGVVPPAMAYIPGTSIQVVSRASGDVFYQGGHYWRYYNGMWWRSRIWSGGWVVTRTVPGAFLRIPASHPKYRVVKYHPSYSGKRGAGKSSYAPGTVKKRPAVHGVTITPGKGRSGKAKVEKAKSGKGKSGKDKSKEKSKEKKKEKKKKLKVFKR